MGVGGKSLQDQVRDAVCKLWTVTKTWSGKLLADLTVTVTTFYIADNIKWGTCSLCSDYIIVIAAVNYTLFFS